MKVVVADYGLGNLRSVAKALARVGGNVVVTEDPSAIAAAPRLVLPGVGAFGAGMEGLSRRGLVEPIRAHVAAGKPFLGICLGLQLLFERSEEAPGVTGLGIVPGEVRRFAGAPFEGPARLKVPHVGWARLDPGGPGDFAYFVHSFYAVPSDPGIVSAWAEYGIRFPAAISVPERGLRAFQFHPEKSGSAGLGFLAEFLARPDPPGGPAPHGGRLKA
ncbi:MAG: imidazole glycerol phosphate synthase subunit HisH [Planctomycetales bacterium]|nr:imidazole glycerol phosphate synthase subunit HisH [Planctomycetales bacterium]